MADQKISELVQINIGDLADEDEFVIADASASDNKSITWGEMTQSSSTDTTAGRLMAVEAFGLGGYSNAPSGDDMNNADVSGFWTHGSTFDNTFDNDTGIVLTAARSTSRMWQIGGTDDPGDMRMFLRNRDSGGWSGWQEFWHTGNLEVQSDPLDDTSGRVMTTRAAGILHNNQGSEEPDDVESTRIFRGDGTANDSFSGQFTGWSFARGNGARKVQLVVDHSAATGDAGTRYYDGTSWSAFKRFWHEGNTTVDGSGFLLEASPIVRVYTDSISEPNQPVGATLTHSETGVYVLSGVPPLASEGWQVRTPEDHNGNKVVAIDPPEYDADAGTLTLRTYDLLWHEGRLVPGDPMDVPDEYFVMLRFHEEPEEEQD
ncbi:MAG: hypothetical protein EYR95_18220 [Phormidium sp. SL48-SHIP]|nr:MAG: hypothetical protein EYR95_18220 [Phormidium sp. SL48-SHIP]